MCVLFARPFFMDVLNSTYYTLDVLGHWKSKSEPSLSYSVCKVCDMATERILRHAQFVSLLAFPVGRNIVT
jgi:hypothetical protein